MISLMTIHVLYNFSRQASARVDLMMKKKIQLADLVQCVHDLDWKKQVRRNTALHVQLMKMKKKNLVVFMKHHRLLRFDMQVQMLLKRRPVYWSH